MPLPFAKSSLITTIHGFFGRRGGVSAGFYATLNCGFKVGDDPNNAAINNAKVCEALGCDPKKRQGLLQTHSNTCHVIDHMIDPLTEGDALVTKNPDIALSVLTADCAPVLFDGGNVVGAAHAGWGGAVGGILESTISAMKSAGAKNIKAAIGPCIGPESYEVSAGFEKPFLSEDKNADAFFRAGASPDKLFFDLPAYCAFRLRRAGVTEIDVIGHDTMAMEGEYFSHRRSTKRGETKRGLQLSVISLKRA